MGAHGTIGAVHLSAVKGRTEVKACPRCGHERKARKNARICADCVSVLSPAERILWSTPKPTTTS